VNLWLFALIASVLIVLGRSVPVTGRRRVGVVLLRVVGVLCLVIAQRGCISLRHEEYPRHLVYLVDQSASIDAQETNWIARRIASLEAIRPRQIVRRILAFGEETQLIAPDDRSTLKDVKALEASLLDAPIARAGTNLEAALLTSLSTNAAHGHDRIILLSDGRQTSGDVERVVSHLRRLDVEVYPIAVPPTEPVGLVWQQLAVPPVVKKGASVPVKLLFANHTTRPQPVEVTISLQGLPLTTRSRQVPPGWHVMSLAVPAYTAGTMTLDISVVSIGSQEQQRAVVEIEGPPRLLLVLERPTQMPLLATALKRRDMELAVVTPRELPDEVGPLLEYEAVLLFHVPKSVLSDPQVDGLEEYVRRFGGGLVTVGLGGPLDYEIAQDAPLDRLLPVRFEPKGLQEAKRRVCMLLVIDRSASMMGPRIAATKRAAIELVKGLAPEDLVGVLAFDTVPYVIVEVQQARQVSAVLIDKLVRLKSTGGTDLLPALKAAQQRLELTGADVKHTLLLSDGNTPFDAKAYTQLLEQFQQQHITISTIGIGSILINEDLLGWLAEGTGGTFYRMNHLDELPHLVARDTDKTLGELPFSEGYFTPKATAASVWFEDQDQPDWPPLTGYLTTTAKPNAIVELEMAHQPDVADPLLAHWPVGTGRVVSFTSDADARWSPYWIRWSGFDSFWAQVMRQVMRSRPTEELFVWFEGTEGPPHVVIEGRLNDPTAVLVTPAGTTIPLALVQVSPFRWKALVDRVASGWYQVVVESRRPDEAVGESSAPVFAKRWVQIGSPSRGPEVVHVAPDEALLRRLAHATGGVYGAPDRAFLPPSEWTQRPVVMRGWLLVLAMVLLLVEIALRGRTML